MDLFVCLFFTSRPIVSVVPTGPNFPLEYRSFQTSHRNDPVSALLHGNVNSPRRTQGLRGDGSRLPREEGSDYSTLDPLRPSRVPRVTRFDESGRRLFGFRRPGAPLIRRPYGGGGRERTLKVSTRSTGRGVRSTEKGVPFAKTRP